MDECGGHVDERGGGSPGDRSGQRHEAESPGNEGGHLAPGHAVGGAVPGWTGGAPAGDAQFGQTLHIGALQVAGSTSANRVERWKGTPPSPGPATPPSLIARMGSPGHISPSPHSLPSMIPAPASASIAGSWTLPSSSSNPAAATEAATMTATDAAARAISLRIRGWVDRETGRMPRPEPDSGATWRPNRVTGPRGTTRGSTRRPRCTGVCRRHRLGLWTRCLIRR